MEFLGQEHVVHADFSCRNTLVFRLEEDPRSVLLKITDFGLAICLEDGADFIKHKQPRAVRWCAPETIVDSKLSHRSDTWQLGMTLFEFFTGGTDPWAHMPKR